MTIEHAIVSWSNVPSNLTHNETLNMSKALHSRTAENIVSRIVEDLIHRNGFGAIWSQMTTTAQHELVQQWLNYAQWAIDGVSMIADAYHPDSYCRDSDGLPREEGSNQQGTLPMNNEAPLLCFGCGKPMHSATFKVIRGATAHPVCQACWEKDLMEPAVTPSAEQKRTVIYTRISPGSDLSTLNAQEQLCRAHLDAKGWTHTRTLSDVASGSATERPQYQVLLKLVEAGGCDAVVVARPDRLERFSHAFAALAMHFAQYGVELVTVFGEGRG